MSVWLWFLVRWRGGAGQCSLLVGLKEMTLLSGFDPCSPCSYVASVTGTGQNRFPEPSGLETGLKVPWKLYFQWF